MWCSICIIGAQSGCEVHRLTSRCSALGSILIFCRYLITRNYDQQRGCVNGVEVVLAGIRCHSITVRMPGGELIVMPRINCIISQEESGLPFVIHRRQYPITPAFALTVHRVQGQTLLFLGIYFSGDVFCHGMLYTALSRVRSWADVCVFWANTSQDAAVPLPQANVLLTNLVRQHIIAKMMQ